MSDPILGRKVGTSAPEPAGTAAVPLSRRMFAKGTAAAGVALATPVPLAQAQLTADRLSAARRWAEVEFRPSTLTVDERMEEMAFFIRAAAPLRQQRIFVLSETIRTHEYEARVLARAFSEITGISVIHDVAQEGEVVNRIPVSYTHLTLPTM